MKAISYRRPAFALVLGALLTQPLEYLFLQTHGPYEEALDQIVWGFNHHDYSRWAIFPALLILPGVRAFDLAQQNSHGRAGLWGCRLSFGGLILATFGQTWDYILFDPWGHPSGLFVAGSDSSPSFGCCTSSEYGSRSSWRKKAGFSRALTLTAVFSPI